ncbi:OmpA family protein [Halomonas urumqiensis]|uniref:Flagellar motor protein MotB n=1 Tax=Halomonas urumqiensis TaxID=1684789 RepID=A0A2N7UPS6_9GAMM|nr:OmpA family protein [Halomonas urumqiensis]PMR82423.1 flagellar motor protein MotB [Halomonas urumqiensis]PTB04096.1 OmpA family protein [Halomonas urumqiensis]GHE19639.1 OmpA family lipoprotein [Halomonas urumqiensis]
MKNSTTGLLLGSALVVGLAGCATPNTDPSSDRAWYQQPIVCGIAGSLIGGGIGYATASDADEENHAAGGATIGAAAGALLCADRSPEPVAEPEPMPEPEPEPVPDFEPVVLSSEVNFAFDSADLTMQAESTLDEVARRLREHTDVNIRIDGHTDSVGSNQYNMGLSQERADSVRSYLMSQGVSGSRMMATGYGEERPVATNETDQGRALNRRVEIDRQ